MDPQSHVSLGVARGFRSADTSPANGARNGARTRASPHSARVSPYPERIRTSTGTPPPPGPIRRRTPPAVTASARSNPIPAPSTSQQPTLGAARSPAASSRARRSPFPSTASQPRTPSSAPRRASPRAASPIGRPEQQLPASPLNATSHQYQLVVQPILKATMSQRDASGESLKDFAVNGSTFREIAHKLWEHFGHHVKGRAVKHNGIWSLEPPAEDQWQKMMQLKLNKHLVDSTKTEAAWNQWLVSSRGKTVKLLIFKYGMALTKAKDLDNFEATCIRPRETDRAGATAEVSLREVANELEAHWGSRFQATTVTWRLWANHITRNLNRSNWREKLLQPPPVHIVQLLRASATQVEQRMANLTRSARMAQDCVVGSLAAYEALQRDWAAFGQRLAAHKENLTSKQNAIDAFLGDLELIPIAEVVDPLPLIENIDDFEHAE
ncbi:hypothetical protein F444_02604 [Phytophthora nicotianae P1976]|uniref:Uncharacterized protein n=1 Tax=Phytophthora nicotianae P1976 TaxID=1317066 RepID=A0A081AWZ1_PHYNI|nr:hypothetical protein F444_02604 [Phytophthora nicotianae P1976]